MIDLLQNIGIIAGNLAGIISGLTIVRLRRRIEELEQKS